jgi:chromosome segregation ATPase
MQAAAAGPIGGAAAGAAAGAEDEEDWTVFRRWVKMQATADGAAAGGTSSAAAGAAGASADTASARERQEARDYQLQQLEQHNAELQKQKQEEQRELNQLKQELDQIKQQEARKQEARKQEAHARKEALKQQAREQLEQHNANLMQTNAQLREQLQQKQDALNALKNKRTGKEQADPAEHEPAAQQPIRKKLKARERTEEEKQAYDMEHQCEQLPGNSSHNPVVFSSSSADEEAPAAQELQEAGIDWRCADRDDAERDDNDGSFGWSRAGRRRKFTDRYRPPKRD